MQTKQTDLIGMNVKIEIQQSTLCYYLDNFKKYFNIEKIYRQNTLVTAAILDFYCIFFILLDCKKQFEIFINAILFRNQFYISTFERD